MAFVKAALAAEIPDGSKTKVDVNGKPVLIVNVGGAIYAMANKCPHMGGSLADGTLEGRFIVCPNHGAKFDVTTGKAAGNAKVAFLKIKVADATSYPVEIQGNDILVDIG